ncbi:MAG: multicopper oxidase domain-containing protein [Ignavibacteriae bacterium]|nr:multicopper oxidase domain-containing protein [Ignavibacteriota bacterium]
MRKPIFLLSPLFFISIFFANFFPTQAQVVEYDLTIAQEEINITGEPSNGMTINGGIPGPTLRFTEGDSAVIHVHNQMDVETSIHWHGILVPPNMDGVPFVSFPPIAAKTTFTYKFPIRQSGTYWYHSHTSLQEQSGVYGSIAIEPKEKSKNDELKDHVLLLSDWTNENPHSALRLLKRGSEWYSLEKGSAQSIIGAASVGLLGDYFSRELQRMPAMDIADIAYNRFLINGSPNSIIDQTTDEQVRLRIINGSASSFFFVEFAGGEMTIISADGINVEPVKIKRLLIGVAETYDVIIDIPQSGMYEFRATAHDGSAYSSAWFGNGVKHKADYVPNPNLYISMGGLSFGKVFALTPAAAMGMSDSKVDAGMFDNPGMNMDMENINMDDMDMHNMDGMGMEKDHSGEMNMHNMHIDHSDTSKMKDSNKMNHQNMEMTMEDETEKMAKGEDVSANQDEERNGKRFANNFGLLGSDVASSKHLAVEGMNKERPLPPYDKLRSLEPTSFSGGNPVREIRLTLDGDMERYVWFINNEPLSESDYIEIKESEVVRFIMINRTMMHHPMHLHGHFFRVINKQGDYSPLKHTVDVAPMSTTVIEFLSNEVGDWFFHCHLLYHMKSGMARVVHYEDFKMPPDVAAVRSELFSESWYLWANPSVMSNMSIGSIVFADTRNIISANWETGWQEINSFQWEMTITWDRYVNRFFTFFAGANLEGIENEFEKTVGTAGIRYLLPLNIETRFWLDTKFDARINMEKYFELTPHISLFGESQYDTDELWEYRSGMFYLINRWLSLTGQWHSEYGWGGGVEVRL